MKTDVPSEMSALVLERHDRDLSAALDLLRVERRPVRQPRPHQVVVRMEAAPCNPSDLLFLQGKYGVSKRLPTVPGWEGAGTVVAAGGSLLSRWLVGKRVACAGTDEGDGTWAEYHVVRASNCVPLRREVGFEQAATLLVNPLTAVAMLELAQHDGVGAAVQNAGASQVGRMLIRLAADAGLPLINIVRRPEQVTLLQSLGATLVLDSSEADFDERLRHACREHRAGIAFDAVAGPMTGTLVNAMPPGSRVVIYGGLSESACSGIDPLGIVFHRKKIEGFYLGDWMAGTGFARKFRTLSRVQRLVGSDVISTAVQARVGLADAVEGLRRYAGNMTGGKILILPGSTD